MWFSQDMLGKGSWRTLGAKAALLPPHLGVKRGKEGVFYSFCAPLGEPRSQSTSPLMKEHFLFFVLELSLARVSKSLQFYIASSDKVQWLGNRLWGALLPWYPTSSPSFSLSHSVTNLPAPTAASKPTPVLSQDTHPSPLTHCHRPVRPQPHLCSAFPGAQCSKPVRASRHSRTHPYALEAALGSSPGPGPELAPGSSAPEAPQLLL